MKTWMLLAGLVVVPASPGFAGAQDKGDQGWHTDYIAAKELARKTGKPMMVVFRCGP